MTAVVECRLGDLLEQDLDLVDVEPDGRYEIAGVHGFGRGVFARAPIVGTETKYSRLNRLHAGQLVLSRLKAFEGAVAVVPNEFDGWFVSTEFPTFRCIEGLIDPRYLAHICRSEEFWSKLAGASKGMGARRERVHPDRLLELSISVPCIDEQRRLAKHLDRIAEASWRLGALAAERKASAFAGLLPGLIDVVVDREGLPFVTVAEAVDFVSDTVHPDDDPGPAESFVGLQHVESHTGRCLGSDALGSTKGRKFRFRPGDVIYGYLRPYLNKVWLADRHGLCSVDQYVLRPKAGHDGTVLAHCLRGRRVLTQAVDLTHSLQLPRLRSGLLASFTIPVAPASDSGDIAARLDRIRDRVVQMAIKRRRQEDLIAALLPSALNQAFNRMA